MVKLLETVMKLTFLPSTVRVNGILLQVSVSDCTRILHLTWSLHVHGFSRENSSITLHKFSGNFKFTERLINSYYAYIYPQTYFTFKVSNIFHSHSIFLFFQNECGYFIHYHYTTTLARAKYSKILVLNWTGKFIYSNKMRLMQWTHVMKQ